MRRGTSAWVGADRRGFLKALAVAGLPVASADKKIWADEKAAKPQVPIRTITKGPKAHWFGYYDKLQFDSSGRYVLGMAVDFESRPPTPSDVIELGMVDLQDGDAWIKIGETSAWCWQQGCMLQWLPGSDSKVIFNTRLEGHYGSVIQDVETGQQQILERPVYTVSPTGKTAMSVNFARLGVLRPGYGYEGIVDPYGQQKVTDRDGIYRLDLETGEHQLVISLARMLDIAPQDSMKESLHWFNHLLFNPSGDRFIFLHRWRRDLSSPWKTRMLTAKPDGSDIHVVADHDMVSHFIWKNPRQILAWSREPEIGSRFFLYDDQSGKQEVVGDGILKVDGHCTYSPDGQWICTDTYPGRDNLHHLYLFRPADNQRIELGTFFQPEAVRGKPHRCDLHPGWSRDGKTLCIDSMMSGQRQMILIDVSQYTT